MSPMVRTPFTLEYALLGYLRSKPMYGYELHQLLAQPTGLGLIWRIKQSQLYALLDKLEKDGYLTTSVDTQQTNRPYRKFCSITPSGEETFIQWLHQPVKQARDIRQEFLAKFYFARKDDLKTARDLIEAQKTTCRSWEDTLERQAEKIDNSDDFDGWVMRYRLQQVRMICIWLDELQADSVG